MAMLDWQVDLIQYDSDDYDQEYAEAYADAYIDSLEYFKYELLDSGVTINGVPLEHIELNDQGEIVRVKNYDTLV